MAETEEAVLVQRFIASLVLVGLLWQQSACCCGALLAHGATGDMLESAGEAHAHAGCCDHTHEVALHCDAEDGAEVPGQPTQGQHEHHICVGSHIFFLLDHAVPALDELGPSSPLAMLQAEPALAQSLAGWEGVRYQAQRPVAPALPLRAALQVFVL